MDINGCSFYDKCLILWQIIDAVMKSFVRDKRFLKNVIIIVPKKDQDFVSNHGIITLFLQLHLTKKDRNAT